MKKQTKATILKILLSCTTILNVIITLSIPIINMELIDKGIIASSWDNSMRYLVLMVIGLLIIDILAGLNYYLSRYIELLDGFKLQENLNRKIHELKNLNNSNEYLPIFTTDIDSMKIKSTSIIYLISGIIKLILIMAFLYIINFQMLIFTLILMIIIPIIPFILSLKLPIVSNEILEKKSYFTNYVSEILNMTKEIRLDSLETQEKNIFSRKLNNTMPSILRFHYLNALFNSNNIIYTVFYFIIMYISIRGIFNGTLTLGELTAVIAFLGYSVSPINEIIMNYNRLKMVSGSSKRYNNIYKKEVLRYDSETLVPPSCNNKVIEVKNLTSEKISNVISFDMLLGEWILIHGESGKGKTSILNIISKLDFDYTGSIKFKNNDIEIYNKEDYLSNFVYILQSHQLFDLALINNEMINIENHDTFNYYLDRLQLSHIIKKEYKFSSLSGGEKQRLLLALALEKDPEILILDEPTAALDKENADLVIHLLRSERNNKNTIIVSHNDTFNFISKKIRI